jgi:hypothetical protein
LNKHQSERENTIIRGVNELKIKKIKEEVTQNMERKKSNRNIKHSGRLLQQTRTSKRQNLRT